MCLSLTVVVSVRSGDTLHQQFGAHPSVRYTTPQKMAGKKKGDSNAALADTTTMTTPPQDEAAATQGAGANSDDISVDTVAEGQHKVYLLDLGISAEDIAAMRRIDARHEEVRRTKQQELQAGPSQLQIITRAKGKETMLSEAERQE